MICCGHGGHVEGTPDLRPTADSSTIAIGFAAVAGMGSASGEAGGLSAGQRSELGHEGEQLVGGLFAEPVLVVM